MPFEVFAALGKAGSTESAHLEAITRLVTMALRAGVDPNEVIKHLRGITDSPTWDGGTLVRSVPDAVALVLSRHMAPADDRPVAALHGHAASPASLLSPYSKVCS